MNCYQICRSSVYDSIFSNIIMDASYFQIKYTLNNNKLYIVN